MWLRINTHPPCLPDLAPFDFKFVAIAERTLAVHRSDIDVLESVKNFLPGQEELFFKTGIQNLQKGWNKCIEVGGDYVEK